MNRDPDSLKFDQNYTGWGRGQWPICVNLLCLQKLYYYLTLNFKLLYLFKFQGSKTSLSDEESPPPRRSAQGSYSTLIKFVGSEQLF